MGNDKGTKKTNNDTAAMIQALTQYAPDAIRALSDASGYQASATLRNEQATAPGYAELQNQIYADYGPEANRIGSEIARANALAAGKTEKQLAEGAGGELVTLADAEQRQLDPEFYASRALIGDAIKQYLASYSPSELTGSELEQINRGISARSGPLTESAMNTVKNAQTFGAALTEKWKNFGDAVTKASSALPMLKSGLTGFEIATRRPLTSNTGDARLTSPTIPGTSDAINQALSFGGNVLGEIGANQRQRVQKEKDAFDKATSIVGLIGGLG